MVGLLIDWLIHWFVSQFVDWIDWSIMCLLIDWFISQLVDLIDWLASIGIWNLEFGIIDWLAYWLIDWWFDWLVDKGEDSFRDTESWGSRIYWEGTTSVSFVNTQIKISLTLLAKPSMLDRRTPSNQLSYN